MSEKTCPPEFGPGRPADLESAVTMNDLGGKGQKGHVCYGKIEGTMFCL